MKISFKPGRKFRHVAVMLGIVVIYLWAIEGSDTNPITFIKGIPFMADYVVRMFPPDLSITGRLLVRAGETLQMAVMGTTFGAALALPLSFFAARNVMPYRPVYQTTRTLFDACRGVNEIVWALLFVSMVGLGPFPGVLALTVHLLGALGKYFSETIEAVNQELVTAIASTGANRIQTIYYGILPQVKPLFVGYTFYYLEHSFRAATVLGLVGAGGIGIELITSVRLFKNQEVLTTLLVMVLTVTAIDRLSAFIRMRLITGVEA
ncbi:MAG: phosphonate ABC transporter, permease protein PhnE [Dehalococcoidales bacterium]|nr:phosphonate ABC transporter, permease protein PhnE [Dehalococcoidales bacterium]